MPSPPPALTPDEVLRQLVTGDTSHLTDYEKERIIMGSEAIGPLTMQTLQDLARQLLAAREAIQYGEQLAQIVEEFAPYISHQDAAREYRRFMRWCLPAPGGEVGKPTEESDEAKRAEEQRMVEGALDRLATPPAGGESAALEREDSTPRDPEEGE